MMARVTPAGATAGGERESEGAGAKVGPYRLARVIGRGGMGVVYEAIHERIGQRAAVKLLGREHEERDQELDPGAVHRFLTEARALSRVAHPGLVRIFDCGETASGAPWISMELLHGELLRARIERHARRGAGLPVSEAMRTARQLASAVAAIHRAGVVHRDLKPDNVMVVADEEAPGGERVKLLDFGIAKLAGDGTTTAEGVVIGTAGYMAPEQCVGDAEVDARADVYAIGVVLYEMLAGRRPFSGDPATVMRQHLFAEPPPIEESAPGLLPELAALVRAMMAKEPSLRPDLPAVIEDLRALESAFAPPSRPREIGAEIEGDLASMKTEPATAPDGAGALRTEPSEGFVTEPVTAADPEPSKKASAAVAPSEAATKLETLPDPAVPREAGPGPSEKPMAPDRGGRAAFLAAVAAIALGAAALAAVRLVTKKPAEPVALPGMARIAGATFRMGSTDAEIEAACASLPGGCAKEAAPQLAREKPAHDVRVSSFQIDVHEVTNAEYAAFLHVIAALVEVREDKDDHAPRFVQDLATGTLLIDLHPAFGGVERTADGRFVARAGRENKPVVQVTWDGASRYCRSAGKRLPTEAEWELAARGPRSRRFPWGEEAPRCAGVVFGRGEQDGCPALAAELRDVATAPQDVTPEGVFDLAGDAGEWVQDQFALAYYPDCGECRDPVVEHDVPLAEDMRIFRGGTFRAPAWFARATTRSRWKRTSVMDGLGFRCASR